MEEEKEEQKPFWSNCFIQALKHYWKDPKNVDFVIIHGTRRFHVMWLDKRKRQILHFTHRKLTGKFSTLWFKGTIENVEYDSLKEWCEKHNVKFNVERP